MMRFASVCFCAFGLLLCAAPEDEAPVAAAILRRYLLMPQPRGQGKGEAYDRAKEAAARDARQARFAVLAQLKDMPEGTVVAAREALFTKASSLQRHEIAGLLADHIHTRPCAELLHALLQDVREPEDETAALYEELMRCSAVGGLRRMSARTGRAGGKRVLVGPEVAETVPGLVPYLVEAANDKAERVRISALYGLADSRDPRAVDELRSRLNDPSEKVRLYAACFLTEYEIAAGLPEMRKALARLRQERSDAAEIAFDYHMQVEMLLASFERITGKSFGEIPMNPMLSSNSTYNGAQRYQELLAAWAAWWDWQPTPGGGGKP